jgi:hypothetical protein
MPDKDNELYLEVKSYAKGKGFRLRPGATSFLRQSTQKVLDEKHDKGVALDAYRKLIDRMVVEASQIKNYPPGGLGERTLYPALSKLCPLFPIC